MCASKWHSRTIPDLIIEVWEALDCESVGARELEQIRQAVAGKFGEGAAPSPASIARSVADEGAVLRHPEVFDFDAEWRERKIIESSADLGFANLQEALESFVKLDEQRQRLEGANNDQDLKRLRESIVRARADVQLRAQSKIVSPGEREEAKEIANWLRVWLESPELFIDWLDLRRRSAEFVKKFGEGFGTL